MSYNSKLIVVNKYGKYGETIAELNLNNTRWSPADVFTKPINFEILVNGDYTKFDKYGNHCCMTRLKNIIEVIEKDNLIGRNRRGDMALAFLKSLNPYEWNDLYVVHYGY